MVYTISFSIQNFRVFCVNGKHPRRQHAEEMKMLEGNVSTVSSQQCTAEFQPSADQSSQSWANNDINQASTYPSPYANVHKGELCKIGGVGGIGNSNKCTWKVPSEEKREKTSRNLENLKKLSRLI